MDVANLIGKVIKIIPKFSLMKNGYTAVEAASILKQVKYAIKGV